MDWVQQQSDVYGILTPDVEGKRRLYDIHSGTYHDLEAAGISPDTVRIGRFHFYEPIFAKARKLLIEGAALQPEWLVVDEIGKLEMEQKKGLEPAISEIIELYQNRPGKANLLLVIRDFLLEKAMEHYNIHHSIVIHTPVGL